jgi:hypothetical protein
MPTELKIIKKKEIFKKIMSSTGIPVWPEKKSKEKKIEGIAQSYSVCAWEPSHSFLLSLVSLA